MLRLWYGGAPMNCPHCGWSMKIELETISREGYFAEMVCDTIIENKGKCPTVVKANTDLLWAYENNRLPATLRMTAHDILLSSGLLATPP